MFVDLPVQDLTAGEYSIEVREDPLRSGDSIANTRFQLQFE